MTSVFIIKSGLDFSSVSVSRHETILLHGVGTVGYNPEKKCNLRELHSLPVKNNYLEILMLAQIEVTIKTVA